MKALIADDSLMMRKVAKMILEKGGYAVLEAEDGAAAVELAKREQPDVVLLDAIMPGTDGWTACRMLKTDPATARIPVLMCTGQEPEASAEQMAAAGADGFVSKPFNPVYLLEKVKQVSGA